MSENFSILSNYFKPALGDFMLQSLSVLISKSLNNLAKELLMCSNIILGNFSSGPRWLQEEEKKKLAPY